MSADGEINVQVRAEGADDAAEELAGGDGGGGGLGGGGGGGGVGLRRLGTIGTALAAISSLLSGFQPLLEFLGAIAKLLSTFLVPISLIITRLLSPVLRLLVGVLPRFLQFMNTVDSIVVDLLGTVRGWSRQIWGAILDGPGAVWQLIKDGFSWLVNGGFMDFGAAVWSFAKRLPVQIGRELVSRLPSFSLGGSDGTVDASASGLAQAAESGVRGAVNIVLNGGLSAFIDEIERRQDVDF